MMAILSYLNFIHLLHSVYLLLHLLHPLNKNHLIFYQLFFSSAKMQFEKSINSTRRPENKACSVFEHVTPKSMLTKLLNFCSTATVT